LTGILKQNNKAQAVIRSIASNTDRQKLAIGHVLVHGCPMAIIKSLGGMIPYLTQSEKQLVDTSNASIYV
jgi:hypothetical protein